MMNHMLTAAVLFLLSTLSTIAATPIICGSTYYVPIVQVNAAGVKSNLPSGVALTLVSSDSTKVTGKIGTMPGGTAPAAILMPLAAATGISIQVTDTTNTVLPGAAVFDALPASVVPPPVKQTIMLDIPNMTSTTP